MDDFHCSFCGHARREVRKLISGPRVFICNDCVDVCRQRIDEKFPPPPAPARPFDSPPGRRLTDEEQLRGHAEILVDRGASLARAYGVELTDPSTLTIPADVLALVPEAIAWRYRVLPIGRSERTIKLAMTDPSDGMAVAAVMNATQLGVEGALALDHTLRRALARHYPRRATGGAEGGQCSFCGERAAQVAVLIAGPAPTMICVDCVELCEDIIAEALAGGDEPAGESP